MKLFRLLMVLALMPVTAWSGYALRRLPLLKWGSAHFSWRPRLGQSKTTSDSLSSASSGISSSPATRIGCCCGGKAAACRSEPGNSTNHRSAECCATGCRCTPVFMQGEVGPSLKKVCVPELTQIDLAVIVPLVNRIDRLAFVDQNILDTGPPLPIDIVVLYERFLI